MAFSLIEAEKTATPLAEKFTVLYPGFSPTQAYEIQVRVRDEKAGSGRRVVGRKIGFTSRTTAIFDDQLSSPTLPVRSFVAE